jgi:nucleoside-diphosphate kinase
MMVATRDIVGKHYPDSDDWYIPTGTKAWEGYKKRGVEIKETPKELGQKIRQQLMDYFVDRPLIAMIWEGPHAVQLGRKTVGITNPLEAAPGTIRGDFSVDSYELADGLGRVVQTLVHASGSTQEAEDEIKLWFKPEEIIDYDMLTGHLTFGTEWGKVKK